MQLLDSDQLEFAFQLHGISHEEKARRFYTDLWNLIQSAEKIRDPLELTKTQKDLRQLCGDYFAFMSEWRAGEEEQYEHEICCASSRENAREAFTTLSTFERQFYRYMLCYLELNRALIQVRAQIAHFARDYDISDLSDAMDVNSATGVLLQRAHKERMGIVEKRLRLDRARALLRHFDPLMESIGAQLPKSMGDKAGNHQLTLFKGAVRKRNFDEAERVVHGWKTTETKAAGMKIIDMARKGETDLMAQDGLMLHTGELGLVSAFLKSDEERINSFMEKFNIPYMVFQYKVLLHQGYLLGRIGSIEGLIIQHAKLLSLAARTHNDSDYAKTQQQQVIIPTRALMGRFKSLGAIFNDMETTMITLNRLFTQTRDYMANAPVESGK